VRWLMPVAPVVLLLPLPWAPHLMRHRPAQHLWFRLPLPERTLRQPAWRAPQAH